MSILKTLMKIMNNVSNHRPENNIQLCTRSIKVLKLKYLVYRKKFYGMLMVQ